MKSIIPAPKRSLPSQRVCLRDFVGVTCHFHTYNNLIDARNNCIWHKKWTNCLFIGLDGKRAMEASAFTTQDEVNKRIVSQGAEFHSAWEPLLAHFWDDHLELSPLGYMRIKSRSHLLSSTPRPLVALAETLNTETL